MVAYEPPSSASPAHITFARFINAFDAFDLDGVLSTFDDEKFEFSLLPSALKVPKMNKKQFDRFLRGSLTPNFDGISFKVHQVIEADNTIVAHAQSDSVSKRGTEWHNEYIFIFKFTTGPRPKIISYTEYANSAFMAAFNTQEAQKAKAKL